MRNPFKPTAGARPPLLVGRDRALDTFLEGLDDGPGAPGLLTIFTGPRGVGKTVMLSEAEDAAREAGWVTISDTATAGLIDRTSRAMDRVLDELGDGPPTRKIVGVAAAGFSVTTQPPPTRERTWRDRATQICTITGANDTGLLISVDEIHAIDRTELTALAADVQHLIREDLPIAFIVAGIPKAVSDLLNETVSTFLRRADRVRLVDVSLSEVQQALTRTFNDTGVAITEAQATRAAEATGGYPFLIQLVGYHLWRRGVKAPLTDELVERGIEDARVRLGATVLQPALSDLSNVDRTYLLKMAEDDTASRVKDIAERLGRPAKYAGVYRRRLLDAGMIMEAGRGHIDFAVPGLRDYLREHAASIYSIR